MPIGLNDLVEYEVHQTRNGRIYTYGSSTGMIGCPGSTGIHRRRLSPRAGLATSGA